MPRTLRKSSDVDTKAFAESIPSDATSQADRSVSNRLASNIFYSHGKHLDDLEFVTVLSGELRERGYHRILLEVPAGVDLESMLSESLKRSDVFVVILSEHSIAAPWVAMEIGAARAYASESGRMLIVAIALGDVMIPDALQNTFVIRAKGTDDVSYIADSIEGSIAAFIGRRAAREQKTAEIVKRIEINSAEYVEEAIQSQSVWERRNRLIGISWHVTGFVALLAGIFFAVYGIVRFDVSQKPGVPETILVSLKTLVVIGLLGACAKYAFMLGKSYVSEALKNADRIHAISFGKFYLKAYGERTTWTELKEVFQNWNIDRSSTFTTLETSQFDPKIIESAVQLVKAITGSKTEKLEGPVKR